MGDFFFRIITYLSCPAKDHHIHQCCEAFVNRAGRIPAPIHRFKEAKKRVKTLKNTNKVSSCPTNWTPKTKKAYQKKQILPPTSKKKPYLCNRIFTIFIMKDLKYCKL